MSEPQVWPSALHAVASTQVPVHALLQHSEAWAQVVPSGAQLVVDEPQRPVVALHWPVQHSPAAVQGTPSLLHVCDVPQTPVPRQVFGEQQSELATHAAPLPLHAD